MKMGQGVQTLAMPDVRSEGETTRTIGAALPLVIEPEIIFNQVII